MANAAGAPRICSLRTIKSDVVVGLGDGGDDIAEKLDQEEPGWKISGKYVSSSALARPSPFTDRNGRPSFPSQRADRERKLGLHRGIAISLLTSVVYPPPSLL